MTISKMLDSLFDLLRDEDFQDPAAGLMSFPAYLYAYPPEEEYSFREELSRLSERLERPPIEQAPVTIDIYNALVRRLEEQTLGGRSLLDVVLEEEAEAKEKTNRLLRDQLDREAFYEDIAEDIQAERSQTDGRSRSYVFVHGWGRIYPYLRASTFMGRMERHVEGFKLILFYPGTWQSGRLQFLGEIPSEGPYRATSLNEKLGE